MSPFYLNLELAKNLSVLEPFGEANPRALFALVGLTIISITAMGKLSAVIRINGNSYGSVNFITDCKGKILLTAAEFYYSYFLSL